MSKTVRSLIFTAIPEGVPIANVHVKTEDVAFDKSLPAQPGGFTARALYASFDPYLRHRMVKAEDAKDFPPFTVGAPVVNTTIVKVLDAGIGSAFQKDDVVMGMSPIQDYVSISAEEAKEFELIQNPHNLDLKLFLGPLGLPGLTAYSFFYSAARPSAGEVILISAATGAVGQIVGELAKREGLITLGSVGSDEKLEILINKLGFHGGFNYRKSRTAEELKRLAPGGIDIFYDNVGGKQLEDVIWALKPKGRIVACGAASQYSIPINEQYGIRNISSLIGRSITLQGCNIADPDMGKKYFEEHRRKVLEWIEDGSFEPQMTVTKGIENAPTGLTELLSGRNIGKAILEF